MCLKEIKIKTEKKKKLRIDVMPNGTHICSWIWWLRRRINLTEEDRGVTINYTATCIIFDLSSNPSRLILHLNLIKDVM